MAEYMSNENLKRFHQQTTPVARMAATFKPRVFITVAIVIDFLLVGVAAYATIATGWASGVLLYVVFAPIGGGYTYVAIWAMRNKEEAARVAALRSKYTDDLLQSKGGTWMWWLVPPAAVLVGLEVGLGEKSWHSGIVGGALVAAALSLFIKARVVLARRRQA